MKDVPWSRRLRTIWNRCSTSAVLSAVVGSSKMRSFALKKSARLISRSCFWLCLRSATSAVGSMSTPRRSKRSRALAIMLFFLSEKTGPVSSCPKKMFSYARRSLNRLSSWWTKAMPAFSTALIDAPVMSAPSKVTVPASAVYDPVRMFMSVDLPAPFSPSRAWISPGPTCKSTPFKTGTPLNALRIPLMVRRSIALLSSCGRVLKRRTGQRPVRCVLPICARRKQHLFGQHIPEGAALSILRGSAAPHDARA